MNAKAILTLFVDTFKKWQEDRAARLAAALAYYTLFSLAPLLIIVVVIVGQVFGPEAARGQIVGQISDFVGEDVAQTIQGLIQNASSPSASRLATIISLVTILWGASNVFNQLQESLNLVWEVKL
ncbi:MAG: YihY/virulence factor BrkB family protein, partial [Chloroflexi bacterium]|nr:YihY/virulence factor BrkB family protein [Chloroflexota bacterium]